MSALPRLHTPLTRAELRSAIVEGHRFALGFEASPERIACALAMLCEEHANGEAIWNHNIGNIDATSGWDGDTFDLAADEVLRGTRVVVTKSLRAYSDACHGAAGYWVELALERRFAPVLVAFDRGDPGGAAAALKAGGWYTGSETEYAAAMVALYREVARMGD